MAFQIGDAVQHGFVDNRQKGRVHGKIWLRGRARPLVLDLQGNAGPDLAGRRVHFRRRGTPMILPASPPLADYQRGVLGDLTALRPTEIPDVPLETLLRWPEDADPPPTRVIPTFYLEWFTPERARIVVQGMDFHLRRSRPLWQLTREEEAERVRQVETAWARYLAEWDSFIERLDRSVKDPEEPWDEYDYERFLQVCEARGEKYNELVEKYGDTPEGRARIAEAMGWGFEEELLEEEDEEGPDLDDVPEQPVEPDPAREGRDWVRSPSGEIWHPLEQRWWELSQRAEQAFQNRLGKSGFLDHPEAVALLVQFRITAGRLGSALRGVAWGEPELEGPLVVACLKRALASLHETQRCFRAACEATGLAGPQAQRLQRELFLIRETILHLMQEFRKR
ncbi:hypothetical protein G4L39_10260 [Limisphaera ngatamarikiensis]|uniref:Uncharacterized protein n=1 Tax=Limisphaera ngatamarikiensis TaxID=1324935 RepID=A0A6M1RWP0_9BACT|nr:hypothetical protein [Limisphaera ngatamarikiensis]NGO39774.1 hypothetical protein [Limisphaera ngatamarikiensis]